MRPTLLQPTFFYLATLLFVSPLICVSASDLHHRSLLHLNHRRHSRLQQRALPAGWSSIGCYSDNVNGRALTSASYTDTVAMTVESCVNFCNGQHYIYAGVEYAQECYCGNIITDGSTSVASTDCNIACTGNPSETCGAGNRLNMYWSGATPPPPPAVKPSVGPWVSLGCYTDGNPRALSVGTTPVGGASNNSAESCTSACFAAGYPLAGMEYADECYCARSIGSTGAPAPASSCNMPCSGNGEEFCGGPLRLNVYNYTGTGLGGGGGGGGGGVTTGLPAGWAYNACWVDNAHGRIFQNQNPDNQALTIQSCVASCASQGFTLAGAEYGVQCFCGDNLVEGAVTAPSSDCNMGCGGNSSEICGGPNRLSVYTSTGSVTAYPVPTAQTTGLPGNWQYSQCFAEPPGARVFPLYMITLTNNNTVSNCLNLCSTFGYPAAGVEYSNQCFCGDVSDVNNNGGTPAPATDCNMACSGDPLHLCGGPSRLNLYLWNGPLTNWQTPSSTGFYEYYMPGLMPPLLATVAINGKISFLEKGGTSEFPNSTGAYELDPSLVPNFGTAWREMHVKTDVFCSGAVVLPDKAGRILNIGGWSGVSNFGIRLYTPDGSAGVNGTNDWEENPNAIQLQSARWYPSALVLSNGSVVVVGGEVGSNAAANPTLEILPRPSGAGQIFLDWLDRTDPNNLYPNMHILPSGRLFVSYYNEARLLDQTTFNTVTVLPNMPGSVVSPKAGRSYPLEGAAVIFPQSAPYTDPVTVLVCGGSNFGIGLDNCVSTQPEVANPVWTIERMPSQRVMPCMVALPDGTFMIMNGAHNGVAGFGLGVGPNLNALLYNPTQPIGSRISILNNSTIPRMYHSEATLMQDGRVLISGSDPETPGLNEELRLEVYIPPYLNQGMRQPVVTVPVLDWAYGQQYVITVQLFQGTTAGMKVSLVGATSSTHGNAMGGRTLFPAFTCAGNTCTVTAPRDSFVSPPGWHHLFILDGPTPSHSVFIRIGGDPGQIGNWPQASGFVAPGIGPVTSLP